jgi:hypothetical protein
MLFTARGRRLVSTGSRRQGRDDLN